MNFENQISVLKFFFEKSVCLSKIVLFKLSKKFFYLLRQANKPKEIFFICKKAVKFMFIEIEMAENHDSGALYTKY
jgi:hypothetical protein